MACKPFWWANASCGRRSLARHCKSCSFKARPTNMAKLSNACSLCQTDGGRVIWRSDALRVIAVEDAHPGFTRVIWNEHVSEMTQLPVPARNALMEAVWQ